MVIRLARLAGEGLKKCREQEISESWTHIRNEQYVGQRADRMLNLCVRAQNFLINRSSGLPLTLASLLPKSMTQSSFIKGWL